MRIRSRVGALVVAGAVAVLLAVTGLPSAAVTTPILVSSGSPPSPFSQNKQNEPAMAVDPTHPNVLVAGSNDEIDFEACAAGNPTTCPFTPGVGVSGIYFSTDSGHTWTQPTYTGWSARNCLGPQACTASVGDIGTLPWYYENGLVSDGDPALAFGPKPGPDGSFSWANGSRLYYGNLVANFSAVRSEAAFAGAEAVGVSRTDDVTAAMSGDKNAWMAPVIVSKQNSALFSDKDQLWADNAASSPFFGNVYACYAAFRSNSHGNASAQPLVVATSSDGGTTWSQQQVTPATNNPSNAFGHSACTIRTDSTGTAYVFYYQFAAGTPGHGTQFVVTSTDGGRTWGRPMAITGAVDTCNYVDPVVGRCMMDGVAGSRDDLSPAPSVDIANGAPSGAGATNEILLTWVDGRDGLNHEKVMFTYSRNRGQTWASPTDVTRAGDRGYFSAVAVSPDGAKAYLTYLSWMAPFQHDTSSPRPIDDVTLASSITSGTPGGWSEIARSDAGDGRGTSQNNLVGEFFGDYVYAIATPTYGATVWTAGPSTAAGDCPAIDAWRMSNETGGNVTRPAPGTDCPADFGNSDIDGFTTAP